MHDRLCTPRGAGQTRTHAAALVLPQPPACFSHSMRCVVPHASGMYPAMAIAPGSARARSGRFAIDRGSSGEGLLRLAAASPHLSAVLVELWLFLCSLGHPSLLSSLRVVVLSCVFQICRFSPQPIQLCITRLQSADSAPPELQCAMHSRQIMELIICPVPILQQLATYSHFKRGPESVPIARVPECV